MRSYFGLGLNGNFLFLKSIGFRGAVSVWLKWQFLILKSIGFRGAVSVL
jgi:hypothetical protein